MAATIEEILSFWFGEPPASKDDTERQMKRWFGAGADIDAAIEARFAGAMLAAARDQLGSSIETARGRLAAILLLDQFPRNLHRGTAAAFAQDERALALTTGGIECRMDRDLALLERVFFYMPMQHSESVAVQHRSVQVFEDLARTDAEPYLTEALEGVAEYARLHRNIIERFGRFPHRNAVLGRANTKAEERYLKGGAPSFGQRSLG